MRCACCLNTSVWLTQVYIWMSNASVCLSCYHGLLAGWLAFLFWLWSTCTDGLMNLRVDSGLKNQSHHSTNFMSLSGVCWSVYLPPSNERRHRSWPNHPIGNILDNNLKTWRTLKNLNTLKPQDLVKRVVSVCETLEEVVWMGSLVA